MLIVEDDGKSEFRHELGSVSLVAISPNRLLRLLEDRASRESSGFHAGFGSTGEVKT